MQMKTVECGKIGALAFAVGEGQELAVGFAQQDLLAIYKNVKDVPKTTAGEELTILVFTSSAYSRDFQSISQSDIHDIIILTKSFSLFI